MDDIDVQNENNKALGIGIFLALVIATGLIIWGWNIISKGTLMIYGNAPFTVSFYKGLEYKCDVSPCKIKEKSGSQNIAIYKDGYRTSAMDVEIKRWRTLDLQLPKFEMETKMVETDIIPQPEKKPSYKIVLDENNNMQKLVKADSAVEKAIVYFAGNIKMPLIFGSKNMALIVDKGSVDSPAYKINISTQNREIITMGSLRDIKDGLWSISGKYFVFTTKNTKNLWVLDEDNRVKPLDLEVEIGDIAWTYKDNLMFFTSQNYTNNSEEGNYGKNYIDLAPVDENSKYYTLGEYHPDENSYTRIDVNESFETKPSNLIPVGSGNEIYFQMGTKNYKLIVK